MNKWVVICLCALLATYIFFPEIFPGKKYKPDPILVHRIDSLEKANNALYEQILKYDSINEVLEAKVSAVDNRIDSVKGKTTIIKEYYREKSQGVAKYTPTQLDSFFKNRYNY